MTTENFYLKRFDRENKLCGGKYTEFRELIGRMTEILDKQGHSGSSASYVLGKMKQYRQMYLSGTLDEFKIEIEFESLFDELKVTFTSTMDDTWIAKFNDLLQRTFAQEPLEPIYDVESDWMGVGGGVYQNRRCSALFKENGVVRFQGGSVLMDFYRDYDGIGTYLSRSVPDQPVVFPFDPFTHEKIYYYQDRISGEIEFHGTYDQIKDRVEALRVKYRRNWLLGFDQEGVALRPELLAPVEYGKLKNLTAYFDDVLRPRIDADAEPLDVMDMRYKDKALFELKGYHETPSVVKYILYSMAIQYSELDKRERKSLFNLKYIPRPVFKASENWQYYFHENYELDQGTCQIDQEQLTGNIFFVDRDLVPVENPRKYLFEKCKESDLEFKAGKRHGITEPVFMSGAFVINVVLNEDRATVSTLPASELEQDSEQVEL